MIFMYFQEEDIRSMLAAKFQVFSTFGSNFNLAGGSNFNTQTLKGAKVIILKAKINALAFRRNVVSK